MTGRILCMCEKKRVHVSHHEWDIDYGAAIQIFICEARVQIVCARKSFSPLLIAIKESQ